MREGLFRRVLIPTDLSEFGSVAMRYGQLFRERFGSKLTLLHVDDSVHSVLLSEHPIGYYLENPTDSATERREMVRRQAVEAGLPADTSIRVVAGHPATEIVRAAANEGVDLIIMGSHGRSGWKRAVLGSVASEVMRKSDRPLMTVTAAGAGAQTLQEGFRSVICAVSGSVRSRQALLLASEIATRFGAGLAAVQVAGQTRRDYPTMGYDELRTWLTPEMRVSARFREMLLHGDVPNRVLGAAESQRGDLIVLSAGSRQSEESTGHGVAWDIARTSHCPVLTVPASPARTGRSVREMVIATP